MADLIPYLIGFIILVLIIRIVTRYTSRFNRVWQSCAQKYRLSFKEGREEKGGRSVRAFRMKGYYRTCLISIYSSPTIGQSETHVTVSYPKNLLDNLASYPEGILGKIGRGLSRQITPQSASAQRPFFISLPATKGSLSNTEVQKELNPMIRETLVQLMIICSGKGRRLDITDAYFLARQQGFMGNPEELFPIIDEMLMAINALESNIGELLV